MHRMPVVAATMVTLLLGVLPPLYFGGIFWWLPSALLLAMVMVVAWLVGYCHNGSHFKYLKLQTERPAWRWSYLLLLLPIVMGLLTLLPVSNAFLGRVSPAAARIWEAVPLMPPRLTLQPGATWERLALLALCLLVYVWCRCNCRNVNGLLLTLTALTAGAVANAFIALGQLFGGSSGVANAVNGAFLNRNHFGFMMSLGICCAAALSGYLLPERRSVAVSKKKGHRVASQVAGKETLLGVLDLSSNTQGEEHSTRGNMLARLALIVVLFVMYCAQLACLSRGAFLAGTAAIVLLTVRQLFRQRGGSRRIRRNFYAILVVVGGAVLFATPFILQRLSKRFETALFQDSLSADARVQVWNASCQMIRKYWLVGTGLGAYRDGIQQFAAPEMPDGFVGHAHNDWLEMVAEGGLPFSTLMLLGLLGGLAVALRRLHRQRDGKLRWMGSCAAIALLTGAFHEWFDFNLQAYPVALAFTVMVAVLNACGDQAASDLDREDAEAMRRERRTARRRRVVAVLACLVIVFVGLPLCVRYLHAEIAHTRLWSALQSRDTRRVLALPSAEKQRRAATAEARLPHSAAVRFRAAQLYAGLAKSAEDSDAALKYQRQAVHSQWQGLCARPGSSEGWMNYAAYQARLDTQERRRQGRPLAPESRPPWLDSLERMVTLAPTLGDMLIYAAKWHLQLAARINPVKGTSVQRELRAWCLIRAVELYQQVVTQKPERFSEILPTLLDIDSDPRWLLYSFPVSRTPQNYTLIFQQLQRRQLYRSAQAMLASLPPEFVEQASILQKARLAAQRHSLSLLNGAPPEESARLWDEWRAAHRALIADRVKKLMPTQDGTEARMAPATLMKRFAEVPGGYTPEALQAVADYALSLGDGESAVMALLYETYTLPYEPDADDLQTALRLLSEMRLPAGSRAERHLQFLRAALPVRLAWVTRQVDSAALRKAQESLEALQRPVRGGKANGEDSSFQSAAVQPLSNLEWHQHHLYSYYAALAAELLGDREKAVACHRRTLELCRTHAPTLLRLREIAQELVAEGEMAELADVAATTPCSYLDISAMLIRMKAAPDTLSNLYTDLTLTVWLQSMAEAPAPTSYRAYCTTAQDVVVGCDLKASDGRNNAQIWQNGALVKCHGIFTMLPLNLVQNTRGHLDNEAMLEIHVSRSGGVGGKDAVATPSYKLREVRLRLKND